MDFALTEEQQLIIKTTRDFVRAELVPHEQEVEETGCCARSCCAAQGQGHRRRAICREHADRGGRRGTRRGELDPLRKELGYTGYALQYSCVARPSNSCWPARRSIGSATCCRRYAASALIASL